MYSCSRRPSYRRPSAVAWLAMLVVAWALLCSQFSFVVVQADEGSAQQSGCSCSGVEAELEKARAEVLKSQASNEQLQTCIKEKTSTVEGLTQARAEKEKAVQATSQAQAEKEKAVQATSQAQAEKEKAVQTAAQVQAEKEKAVQEALAEKEKAVQEALAEKEKAVQEALAEKEKAVQEALAEKEKAVQTAAQAQVEKEKAVQAAAVAEAEQKKANELAASGAANCDAIVAERDALQTSRRELAASLEEVNRKEAQLSTTNKELEAKVGTLTKSTEALAAAERAKAELQEQLSRRIEEVSSLERTVTEKGTMVQSAQNDAKHFERELSSVKELLSKAHSAEGKLLEELSSKHQFEYLFSLPQFIGQLRKLWTFSRSATYFAGCKAYRRISSSLPDDFKQKTSVLWDENVASLWRTYAKPGVDNGRQMWKHNVLPRLSSTSQTVRRLASENVLPHVEPAATSLRRQSSEALLVSKVYALTYFEQANQHASKFFFDPLSAAFPEVKPLVPSTGIDRIFMVAFLLFASMHALRIVLVLLKMVGCCGCLVLSTLCGRRRETCAKSSKGGKATKRPRKSFQPAAATAAAGNSQTAARSGKDSKAK